MTDITKTPLITALGAALATGIALAPAAHAAADNPFAANTLSSGYMVADSHKPVEGKCGEGKCGAGMMKGAATPAAGDRPQCDLKTMDTDGNGTVSMAEFNKFHEGMFTQWDANKDGALDNDELNKMKEGMCGAKMMQEGKCGEGKCGGAKK